METSQRMANIPEYCGGIEEAKQAFLKELVKQNRSPEVTKLMLWAYQQGFNACNNIIAEASKDGRIHVFESIE